MAGLVRQNLQRLGEFLFRGVHHFNKTLRREGLKIFVAMMPTERQFHVWI